MQSGFCAAAMALVLAFPAATNAQTTHPDSATVRSQRERFSAMIARDFIALDTLFGEDLVYTHTSGLVDNKDQFLESVRTGRNTYLAITPRAVRVQVLGDSAAVLTGSSHMVLAASPTSREFDIRFTEVQVRRQSRWVTIRWQSTRYRLEAGFAPKRKLSGQATWWFGRFYTGNLHEYILTAAWKPSPLFIVELNGTRNHARLPEGNFTQEVIGARFRVNVSPDLQVNTYAQYDNESGGVGTNTRLRWTFSSVGDLFVVYNHNIRELLDPLDRHRGYAFDSNQLLVKLQYAFRY